MDISVVIPTLNESENIASVIDRLFQGAGDIEIIVADGGSTDDTVVVAKAAGAFTVQCDQSHRGCQMNRGAAEARGDVLYFVHADTLPPQSFAEDITQALQEGYDMGCYKLQFDGGPVLLKVNSWFSKFSPLWCRGGDQSLFILRSLFEELGGYKEEFVIMEDYEFIKEALAYGRFKVIPKYILASTRKYASNNYLKVQLVHLLIFNLYRWGMKPRRLAGVYKQLISHRSPE